MSKSYRGLFVLLVVVALVVPTTAFASHSWGGYHWYKPGSTVTLVLGDNVSGAWDGHFANAEADWDQSTVLSLSIGAGGTTGRKCRPVAGRVEVCNAAYGANGWLGLASIWLSGGHISQGTVKNNDSYFMYESEKRHVICQEIGHTFGLGHTSEDGSSQNTCMDYYQNTSNSDMTSTSPNAHDYSMLSSIYAHSGAMSPIVMSKAIPSGYGYLNLTGDLETLGEEIYRSEDGRSRVYRLQFGSEHDDHEDGGDGIEIITHAYLAGPNNPAIDEQMERSPWLRDQE
jgi:hypothetical protein